MLQVSRGKCFNVTNSVRFDAAGSFLNQDLVDITGFGKFNQELTSPRVMQFSLRFALLSKITTRVSTRDGASRPFLGVSVAPGVSPAFHAAPEVRTNKIPTSRAKPREKWGTPSILVVLRQRRVAHPEPRPHVLRDQFDGTTVFDGVVLRQILHGVDQQPLSIDVARIGSAFAASYCPT